MKKDLLMMCQYFYPEYVSSSTLPTDLAEDLVKKGLTVDVICGYPKEYYRGEKVPYCEFYKGIKIKRVPYTEFNNKTKIGRVINFFSFFLAICLRLSTLLKYKCILVYSNPPILSLIPYFISRFSKTKFIFVAFDIYPDNALLMKSIKKGGFIEKFMHFINRKVYTNASRIVAIGNEMKNYLIDKQIAPKSQIINVIPNWYTGAEINDRVIKNKEFRELREKWAFIVLYSGNMGTCQDLDTILSCLSGFKGRDDILFIFSGHGNKVDCVKTFIEREKITNAKVYGFLLGEDYADVLKISDVCLVSLTKGVEGLGVPSKTYGYLAAGKPVLAIMSDNTDIARNLFEYDAGGCVVQGNVEGLRKLIIKYMEDKEHTMLSGKNARKIYDNLYRRERCTDMYYSMIKEVIDSP